MGMGLEGGVLWPSRIGAWRVSTTHSALGSSAETPPPSEAVGGARAGGGGEGPHLQLLQLAHVAVALRHHVPHLVLVLLLLLQPLRLLPLLLLLGELRRGERGCLRGPAGAHHT